MPKNIELKNGRVCNLDPILIPALNTLVHNSKKDWDFVIPISGDGTVRVGKSVFAMNIGAYLADRLGTPFSIDNIFWDASSMILKAQESPPNTVFILDEGRESLSNKKRFTSVFQELSDFFTECGQLNHMFIIVLPDFFELPKEIAVDRTELLFNVYRGSTQKEVTLPGTGERAIVNEFTRGFFECFNRKQKEQLFYIAKRTGIKTYKQKYAKPNFYGNFHNNYPVDEELYRQRKKESLLRFAERHKPENLVDRRSERQSRAFALLLRKFKEITGMKVREIAEIVEYDRSHVSQLMKIDENKEDSGQIA